MVKVGGAWLSKKKKVPPPPSFIDHTNDY